MAERRRFGTLRAALASCVCTVMVAWPSLISPAQETDLVPSDTPEEPLAEAEFSPSLGKPKPISQYDIPGLKKRINFGTRIDWDIVGFIRYLAHPTTGGNLNVAISPTVKGAAVKVMLRDVSVGDALEIALAANNLAYEVRGTGESSIINIMTDAEYRARHGVGFYEKRDIKIIELKHSSASRVVGMLKGMKSDIGTLIFDEPTSTLVLIDTPSKIKEMIAVASMADRPTETVIFRLQYAMVADVADKVGKAVTVGVGSIAADERTRTLIVTDLPAAMKKIAAMIEAFDIRKKEVSLQAKIVEVELSDDFKLGVNWNHVLQNLDPRFKIESVAPLSAGSGASLTFKTVAGGGDLSFVLDALKTIGDTKVISNPQISVEDGPEAEIKVIREQPYRLLQYESGSTNVIAVNYKFVEIGVILKVTAKINDEGFIGVDIKATISDLVDWYDAPAGSAGLVGVPVVKKSEASTTVTVKDGMTIVIGGMIKEEMRKTEVGIPILRHIPLVGRLFRSTIEGKKRVETIVLLTPKIITGEESFLQMSKQKRELKFRKPRAVEEGKELSAAKVLKTRQVRKD